jgi:hypothetical protein
MIYLKNGLKLAKAACSTQRAPAKFVQLACGCAILLSLAVNSQPAQAVLLPSTFAQFHQTASGPNANVFAYINNAALPADDAELVTNPGGSDIGGAIPVVFNFLAGAGTLPVDLQGNLDATLTLTSSTKAAVTNFGPNIIGDQAINGDGSFINKLTITLVTPIAEPGSNLLTVTFVGQLLGALNGAPQLSADTQVVGETVTFSSDFLTFSGAQRQFSLTFSSWNGGLQITPPFFQATTAAGAGTFAANATFVPEPSTFAMGIIGLTMVLVGFGRRRRNRIHTV